MVQLELHSILDKYEHTDKEYFALLSRIEMFCSENYLPLIEQAESEGKRVYLIVDSQEEAAKEGIYTDGTIYLEEIGIR